MNIVICHGYAHRLRETGVVESTPVTQEGTTFLLVITDKWMPRTADSMDLSGGDAEFIRETLERYGHIFTDGLVRLPYSQPSSPAQPVESRVL